MCVIKPKVTAPRPPNPPAQSSKMSREEILGMIKPTQAKPQQLKAHRGIPNFLEMHYNSIGHTPGSREEKYSAISDVGVRIGAESYADWHKRHTEHTKASQKRVATYTNDDGTTTSFEYMKVEVDKVVTGTIQADTIATGSIRDFHHPSSKEERIRNVHWLRTGEWTPTGPVYGDDNDPEGVEYQNYRRVVEPDYVEPDYSGFMHKKDYEIYRGKLKRPVPEGPPQRPHLGDLLILGGDARMYQHDGEKVALNIASTLFAVSSIGILIINLMGG